jgi:hypothetical protein
MEELKKLVETHHDSNLVKKDKSPNENTQILIFNDGEIVMTKGGWAFLQRSFHSIKSPLTNCVSFAKFPMSHYGKYSFAIVKDLETAILIRDAIVTVVK